jgi:hypothetical protein
MGIRILFFLVLSFCAFARADYAVISDVNAVIKILPHDDAYKLGNAMKGDSFKILVQKGDWYHIEYKNLPAWVHSRYVVNNAPGVVENNNPQTADQAEQDASSGRQSDLSKSNASKATDQSAQQNRYRRNPETGLPRKYSGRTQSRQARSVVPVPAIPEKKNEISNPSKPSDSIARSRPTGVQSKPISPDEIMGSEKEEPSLEKGVIFIVVGAVGLVLIVIFVLLRFFRPHKRIVKIKRSHFGMEAAIVANIKVTILNSLTNGSISLTEYLTDMGFKVYFYSDLNNAKTYLLHYIPDLVVVDWQLDKNIQNTMSSILAESKTTVNTTVVFYNVPDSVRNSDTAKTMAQAHFLSTSLSDQDFSKIVTPLFKVNTKEKRFKESVQTTALEGEIQQGNLSEVLQFIEMGKKTGCLYIVDFGVVYFDHGLIVYAVSPTEQGKNAVVHMLDLTSGHFHFVLDKISPNRNTNNSCLEIVAEWTRINDEALRTK